LLHNTLKVLNNYLPVQTKLSTVSNNKSPPIPKENVSNFYCDINRLLVKSFGVHTYEEKMGITLRGRPTPTLPNFKSKTKNCYRYFKECFYKICDWLCGCSDKLYCWPCILFSHSESNIWSKYGFTDMFNFHGLKIFGKNRIDICLSEHLKKKT
jgi:hypothetical protein